MREKIEILLIEDDINACKNYISLINEMAEMNIIGVTNNIDKTTEYIKEFLPDVILFNMELQTGGINKANVFTEFKSMPLCKTPYIVGITCDASQNTNNLASELGVDFVLDKNQEYYSESMVLEFIKQIAPSILARRKLSANCADADVPKYNQKRMQRYIVNELNKVNINPKSVGYQYLIDAIEIMMSERTQNVAKIIGERYKKTEVSVIRAMQNAIERAWKNSNIDVLQQYYTAPISSTKGAPTITEFICFYANKLNNEY